MKLVISHSDFNHEILYFDEINELLKTEEILWGLNRVENRNIALLINPISGKRKARALARTVLKPMLKMAKIKYDFFETDSSSYIENWVGQFKEKSFPFSDIICLGGDGLFSQLINAIANHPK